MFKTYSKSLKKGFSIVEVMIVVVIIGILAAMAIPAFNHVREQARIEKAAKAGPEVSAKFVFKAIKNPSSKYIWVMTDTDNGVEYILFGSSIIKREKQKPLIEEPRRLSIK